MATKKKSSKKKTAPESKKKTQKTPKLKEDPSKNKEFVLKARTRKHTPNIFKIKSRKATPIVFSLEEVDEIIKKKASKPQTPAPFKETPAQKKIAQRKVLEDVPEEKRTLGAASLADILGFNPHDTKNKPKFNNYEDSIPEKHKPYYKALLDLRTQVLQGLEMHTKDTLKRSSKDDTGELSAYSQHMADVGTDTFDRDFALSLVSNEQDALFEIEEAIQRIIKGTYGICEITGKPIAKDRLKAVPFTRYSIEGQKQLEATKKTSQKDRGGIFSETNFEESAKYTEEEV